MENLGFAEFAKELQRLNPTAKFTFVFSNYPIIIQSKQPIGTIKLPSGYYYSEKNGITNKHNTSSGAYEIYEYEFVENYN